MKRTFTLLCSLLVVSFAMAQRPTGVFAKASAAPEIDGVVDEVWAEATVYNIDKPFQSEVPSLGEEGETTWQAMWTEDGVYILLKVTDDAWLPAASGQNNWEYDKPEIYFDVNYVLEDGIGGGGGAGHHQFAPGFTEGKTDGQAITDNEMVYAFLVEGSNYIAEYFIPYTRLTDKDGAQVDLTNTIAFDVTIIDRDPGDAARKRAVWANVGAINESYGNMNDCGYVTFEDAEPPVYVDELTLPSGLTITTDNGTLQMVATIIPEDASNKNIKWTVVNGTGKASISATGLLTGIVDGTVSVKATATDGMGAEAMVDVEISGQVMSRNDIWNSLNLIKNWNTDTDLTSWGGWVDDGETSPGQVKPAIEDGVVVMVPVVATDGAAWHYQHNQSPLAAEPDVPYVLAFKSWASGDAPAVVDFESAGPASGGEQYNRYGASADENAVNGRSEWNYNLTAEPQWFEFHVTFDQIVPATVQKVQWMLSLSTQTIYLDSVILVPEVEYNKLATLPPSGVSKLANSINKVYPNPVGNGNALFVELSKVNTKVAIYNAVGQKMMETVSTGNLAKFDVSSLRQGMYFVKLGDGSVQKFIR